MCVWLRRRVRVGWGTTHRCRRCRRRLRSRPGSTCPSCWSQECRPGLRQPASAHVGAAARGQPVAGDATTAPPRARRQLTAAGRGARGRPRKKYLLPRLNVCSCEWRSARGATDSVRRARSGAGASGTGGGRAGSGRRDEQARTERVRGSEGRERGRGQDGSRREGARGHHSPPCEHRPTRRTPASGTRNGRTRATRRQRQGAVRGQLNNETKATAWPTAPRSVAAAAGVRPRQLGGAPVAARRSLARPLLLHAIVSRAQPSPARPERAPSSCARRNTTTCRQLSGRQSRGAARYRPGRGDRCEEYNKW